MEKATFVLALLSAVFTYFSISEQRLIEFKIFAVWCCLAALTVSHAHSLYLLGTSDAPISLTRILTLNIAALGVLVLLGTAVFFKKYLRYSLEYKKPSQ
jgi:hypothetical protein